MTALIAVASLWLGYSNGANDNFKGVATLYGSNTTSYRGALWWATITTLLGAVLSILIAGELVAAFSGKGLVSDTLAADPAFAGAVGLGAAATIFLATLVGMPTSTTHALIGGLAGAAIASGTEIGTSVLASKFALPMVVSPILAIVLAAVLYIVFNRTRLRLGVTHESCICLEDGSVERVRGSADGTLHVVRNGLSVTVDSSERCAHRYGGAVAGLNAQTSLNAMHYVSAGAVCFSRAVNDTPKLAALLLMASIVPSAAAIGLVALVMVVGGLVQSRRVAETMGNRITELNTGQGFTANLTTAGLVLVASKFGVPVSTTHVSCGSIFGIGAVKRRFHWRTVTGILVTWLTTLPAAAVASGVLYTVLT